MSLPSPSVCPPVSDDDDPPAGVPVPLFTTVRNNPPILYDGCNGWTRHGNGGTPPPPAPTSAHENTRDPSSRRSLSTLSRSPSATQRSDRATSSYQLSSVLGPTPPEHPMPPCARAAHGRMQRMFLICKRSKQRRDCEAHSSGGGQAPCCGVAQGSTQGSLLSLLLLRIASRSQYSHDDGDGNGATSTVRHAEYTTICKNKNKNNGNDNANNGHNSRGSQPLLNLNPEPGGSADLPSRKIPRTSARWLLHYLPIRWWEGVHWHPTIFFSLAFANNPFRICGPTKYFCGLLLQEGEAQNQRLADMYIPYILQKTMYEVQSLLTDSTWFLAPGIMLRRAQLAKCESSEPPLAKPR
ncbi:uncharacterized protein BP5553_01311 [Venustampulla echinocandica]|uniref:Uncharacterized protein n=1 Tax=Venustampulla echinocandica TaxID=2656787 RepID=A0A370U0M4_9HELO|nr:uncharacterized protein BP5553_01311 [Venustampulla echinocandica]RDL41332.1 hypothetical protein BP5553_01311 [Venustampulla echinocandica]